MTAAPATVEVLLDGYVREEDGVEHVGGTVALVRSGNVVLVSDPGLMDHQGRLRDALASRGLAVDDVTHVFVSHHHLDHTRNIGMFPTAVVVDVDPTYDGDVWGSHAGDGFALTPQVEVIATPGHSFECASLVVRTADQGVVVLTHAWWFSDLTPEQDPLGVDQAALDASRERLLALADVVVPGHGPAFTNPRRARGAEDARSASDAP